ncbi:MAG: hypothetical protein JOZ42_09375 [Acetobacteraceae bacterium]|nr:hypothetical protein [Acetobacteraceae bacterium]
MAHTVALSRSPARVFARILSAGLLWLAGASVAACAYDPPVAGDHTTPKYTADLEACRETAAKAAHHTVIGRGYLFLSYPISYPIEKRAELRKCMTGRGYALS